MGWASRLNKRVLVVADRQAGGDPRNNYMKKIDMMLEGGGLKPGRLQQADIYHAGDCPVFDGGLCICNPDITIKPLT